MSYVIDNLYITANISYTIRKCFYFSYTTGFIPVISHIPQLAKTVVFEIYTDHLAYFSNTIIYCIYSNALPERVVLPLTNLGITSGMTSDTMGPL